MRGIECEWQTLSADPWSVAGEMRREDHLRLFEKLCGGGLLERWLEWDTEGLAMFAYELTRDVADPLWIR